MAVPISSSSSKPPAPSKATSKKPRVARRRGRALDSDDEIEREARSDESDSASDDDRSSIASSADSEIQPVSEDVPSNGDPHIVIPGTSHSPQSDASPAPLLPPKDAASVNGTGAQGPFMGDVHKWSDMVADEDAHGVADLPVIDFSDLGKDTAPPPQKIQKSIPPHLSRTTTAPASVPKPPATAPAPEPGSQSEHPGDGEEEPIASTSRMASDRAEFKRPSTQAARQAYQQRLEKDPSFVPTVGEFWGHDDRLLDKDLRSLSGWWRGRWQGRGRGFGPRGRGRGGFVGGRYGEQPDGPPPEDLPPIERAWTHDGFEEMKQRDERRRLQHQKADGPQQQSAGPAFRGGRGGYAPRGGLFPRGNFAPSPTRGGRGGILLNGTNSDRVWYAMKPERMWTKQHEGFLHLDAAMKPRPGFGQGYKIRFPGGEGLVVRAPPRPWHDQRPAPPQRQKKVETAASDYSDIVISVRLPTKSKGKAKATNVAVTAAPVERAPSAPRTSAIPTPSSVNGSLPPIKLPKPEDKTAAQSSRLSPAPAAFIPSAAPPSEPVTQLPSPPAEIPPTMDSQQPDESSGDMPTQPPRLDPLTIPVFTPAAPPAPAEHQPSPAAYGSPYGYPPPLPPGIAMGHNGVPYEVATGRPVYLQTPPPMFNPRPMMPAPFVPGHMHHHSSMSTPDYGVHPSHAHSHSMSLSHSRPPSMSQFIDPSTGAPVFTPPRQSSRIEIRPPGAASPSGQEGGASMARPSPLRGAVGTVSDGDAPGPGSMHVADPAMMAYNPYAQPQSYYYPEQYGGYYPEYPQYPQYDMYQQPPPPEPQQGTVYY